MATPSAVTIPVDTWVKVATAVTQGNVWINKPGATYLHYYVATGGAAPTDLANAANMPEPGLPISVSEKADIYVYAAGKAGEVIVAL